MCDTFVNVHDHGVLFAKNSDRDPNEAQVLSWVPRAVHAAGTALDCTWSTIPQVGRTHAVLLSRPFWMWGAEMGVNEHGVAIGNEAVFAHAPLEPRGGLLGMDLVRLGLERGASAAEAAEVIRTLVAAHGQGGRCGYSKSGFSYHNSFLVADRREARVVEAVGRETAVECVRRGVRAISNGLTLADFRPRARGALERVAMATRRRARTECLAAGAVRAADAAQVLSDHGPAGRIGWHWSNGAMGAPCMHAGGLLAGSQSTASWISELGPGGDRHWATAGANPCLALWRPVTVDRPRETGRPTGSPDPHSLWWRHERLNRALLSPPRARPPSFDADRARVQRAIFAGEADGWELAEDWLSRWEGYRPAPAPDARPWWLRRYWRGVEREAGAGSRLPWRDPD
jgi:hypothetical protein